MSDVTAASSKPALLFLCHRLPYPPDKGEKIRAFRILEHLAQRYQVHLGCFIDDADDVPHVKAVEDHCASLAWFPRSPKKTNFKALGGLLTGSSLSVASFASGRLQAWVQDRLATTKPEAIFIYSSAMAQFIDERDTSARVIMDFVDVDSDKWRQYATTAGFPMSWVYAREARKLLEFDRRVASEADASLFVSEAEASLFRTLSPETAATTHAMANGVDCDYFSPAHAFASPFTGPGPHLVFTGTMDYRPNVDAVVWFADEIFPAVRRAQPGATFTIVGSKPSKTVMALSARPGIAVTGRTPDVRPYLAAADVVVAPMRIARGIQNKVLEGMAMAKPVVTTSLGLEGIAAEAGRHLIVADTPGDFVKAILELEPEKGVSMGRSARQLMEGAYGWRAQLAALDRLLS